MFDKLKMKKLLVMVFLFLIIFFVNEKSVEACSCVSGCSAGTCQDVSYPVASCEPVCNSGYVAGPWAPGCVTMQCSCANVTGITCCPETAPPPPPPGDNNTPTPGPSIVPSPTPVQPTEIINLVLPPPETFSKKATTDVQNWICLQTTPCSTSGSCSGGDPQHRVLITTKTDTKLIPNTKTYIFECLETNQGYQCTTGDGALDENLTGTNYLPSLLSNYGYQFVSLTDTQNSPIQQSFTNQPILTDGQGSLGQMEWESLTTTQVGRIIMAMQRVLDNNNNPGTNTQQLGTFSFDSPYHTSCVMIKWDPHGTVFDIDNLMPIAGVKVTLLHKNENNIFVQVKNSDVFNGLENPQITLNDGKYAFFVPDGTYSIKIEREGYQPVLNTANIDKKILDTYPQIYDGGEIVTKGKLELRNLAMKKISVVEKTLHFFQDILSKIKNSQ